MADHRPASNTGRKQERPRGASLEDAIVDAAWEQLTAEGYGHFTIDTVAARARTSKPVLRQRWKTSDELLRAAVQHRGAVSVIPDPDTGTLRGDFIVLLRRANTLRSDLAALLSGMLGSYYDQTGRSPADLRSQFLTERTSATERAIERAVGRGEIDPARLTPRIASLPFVLWRHEVMMTLKPVPDHVLRQIADDIFVPLVARRDEPSSQRAEPGRPARGQETQLKESDHPPRLLRQLAQSHVRNPGRQAGLRRIAPKARIDHNAAANQPVAARTPAPFSRQRDHRR
jgi:AcrR family transcriptional regulator